MKYAEILSRHGKRIAVAGLVIVSLSSSVLSITQVSAQVPSRQDQLFTDAAREFGVPKSVLLSISYNESRWQPRGATPSVDGGYGLMDLTTKLPPENGRGADRVPPSDTPAISRTYTLDAAANLLHVSPDTLKKDDRQNIRGGAAVLAAYAKELHGGTVPSKVADWYDVVAKYSGTTSVDSAQSFADEVFATLRTGASATVPNGTMNLGATVDALPDPQKLQALKLPSLQQPATAVSGGAQCPVDLTCRFVPAGYATNSSDLGNYGNYDHANRPSDMPIKYIIIHDTEGSYQSAINHFLDTASYVSSQYVIRSSDGDVTQMVRNEDVSWGAGDWYVNMHGINIEHEGIATQGKAWYTEQMYQASAKLVRYLAQKYNIPLDREHIIGHDNVPTVSPAGLPGQHWDPGPYWNWNHYMALLHGVSDETERANDGRRIRPQKTVAIAPDFATNQPAIADCSSGSCTTLPTQSSSTVFLHSRPDNASPLLSDPYLHAAGVPGTNHTDDWGSNAATGQRYVVADRQGDWTGIWYGGTVGWFYNPDSNRTAVRSQAETITPRAGRATIPVYGVAYPEAAAYPSGVPVQSFPALYNMPAGQSYVANTEEDLPTDYFYDATINYSKPHDHEVIKGQQKYYQITYNHRIAYVKASDVTVNR